MNAGVNNMKKISIGVLVFLAVAPFVLTGITYSLLPSRSAIHVSLAGEVTLGPKAVIFILPVCIVFYICIHMLLRRNEQGKEFPVPAGFQPLSKTFYFTLLALNLWSGWLLYVVYYLTCVDTKLYLFFPACSLLIIFASCISMALRRNSQIGIRTPWSKYSREVWDKTQKAGAFLTFLLGSLTIFGTMTNGNGTVSAAIFLVAFIVDAVLCIYISYYFYKQARAGEKQDGEQNC